MGPLRLDMRLGRRLVEVLWFEKGIKGFVCSLGSGFPVGYPC